MNKSLCDDCGWVDWCKCDDKNNNPGGKTLLEMLSSGWLLNNANILSKS